MPERRFGKGWTGLDRSSFAFWWIFWDVVLLPEKLPCLDVKEWCEIMPELGHQEPVQESV